MSSGHEIAMCFQFLYATLSGDSTLSGYAPGGIHRGVAPIGASTPFVVMSLQSTTDTLTANAYRILTKALFQVRATGPASNTAGLANAASRIDALLKLTSGAVTGGLIFSCYRDGAVFTDEIVDGDLWSNVGGMYAIEIQQT